MQIAWHTKRWWIFACEKTRKKKNNKFLLSNACNVYNLRVLARFDT